MQLTWSLPENGDVVGGKYRVERALGMGGMGAVFEATHLITQRRFALKWLLNQPASSDTSVKRFVREAKVAGRCQHRHIVEVYDIHQESGSLFMVMELLRGESLADRLLKGGRMHAPEAIRLLLPCLSAIEAAHAAGIVHRDIKPANLFVCQADDGELERAKVLDFGVACFSSPEGLPEFTKTHSGAVLGTPFYMAPEQMRGLPTDRRVDVYALGVTLYEMFSAERPFFATAYAELVLQVSAATPMPLEERVDDLPIGLGAIVRRAMARDPDQRYPTVRALADALAPFVEGARPTERPFSPSDAPLPDESVQPALPLVSSRRRGSGLRMWLPLMAAAIAIAGVTAFAWPRPRPVAPRSTAFEPANRTVARTPTAVEPPVQSVSAAPVEPPPSTAVEVPSAPVPTIKPRRSLYGRSLVTAPPPTAAGNDHDEVDLEPAHPSQSKRAAVQLERGDF